MTRPERVALASTPQASPPGQTVTASSSSRARSTSGTESTRRTSVSAVPTELSRSSGRAPSPAAAARWSCPAMVTGTPAGIPDIAAASSDTNPIAVPAARTGGKSSADAPVQAVTWAITSGRNRPSVTW